MHAVSITPLVVPHRSLPCDKKVVTGNGGGGVLGHVLLGFLTIDNLYCGQAIIVVFPLAQVTAFHTWKFLLELVKSGLAIFR